MINVYSGANDLRNFERVYLEEVYFTNSSKRLIVFHTMCDVHFCIKTILIRLIFSSG